MQGRDTHQSNIVVRLIKAIVLSMRLRRQTGYERSLKLIREYITICGWEKLNRGGSISDLLVDQVTQDAGGENNERQGEALHKEGR